MKPEIRALMDAVTDLRGALALDAPEQTIEKLYQELVAAHQIWWETTEEWKAINAQFPDRHDV